jgi:uncharacterized protein YecE (DUF72 family)
MADMTSQASLTIGCAIWAYDGWAGNFFPPGTPKEGRLRAYAQRLTGVEINATFYATPAVPTVKRWAEDTPEGFRFCPKFPKTITHTAQLANVDAQTATFLGTMRVLGPRLGPLMLQLPPSFGPLRLPVLQRFLERLPPDLEIAVEVRHPDWFTEANAVKLDKALADAHASRVVFDVRPAHQSQAPEAVSAQEKKPDVPLVPVATQPHVIVRYISSPILGENAPFFAEWTPRLVAWLNEGRRVYFFAHCPQEELSPSIAREVYHRAAGQVILPMLPWDALEGRTPPPPADPGSVAQADGQPSPPKPPKTDTSPDKPTQMRLF